MWLVIQKSKSVRNEWTLNSQASKDLGLTQTHIADCDQDPTSVPGAAWGSGTTRSLLAFSLWRGCPGTQCSSILLVSSVLDQSFIQLLRIWLLATAPRPPHQTAATFMMSLIMSKASMLPNCLLFTLCFLPHFLEHTLNDRRACIVTSLQYHGHRHLWTPLVHH